MNKKEIKYLPFVVGYLGKPDYQEVVKIMKTSEIETFNALEGLVKKGKLKTEVVGGKVKYFPKYTNEVEEDA